MHRLHHVYIKDKYFNNSRLFLTDRDSLMYEIKAKDVYEDFSKDKIMFILAIILLGQNNIIMIQIN